MADDPLYDAERQMAERMTDIFGRAASKLADYMRGCEYTEAALRSGILYLIDEDPEFRKVAESMATFFQTYEGNK